MVTILIFIIFRIIKFWNWKVYLVRDLFSMNNKITIRNLRIYEIYVTLLRFGENVMLTRYLHRCRMQSKTLIYLESIENYFVFNIDAQHWSIIRSSFVVESIRIILNTSFVLPRGSLQNMLHITRYKSWNYIYTFSLLRLVLVFL